MSDPRLRTDGKLKELTCVVNSLLGECLPRDFEWTSLQIDVDSMVTEQVNTCQVGKVACLLLGNFLGGSLHCKLCSGCPSVVIASTDWIVIVDAGQYYFSDEFTGNRISIMAYDHACAHKVPQDYQSFLQSPPGLSEFPLLAWVQV